MPIPAELCEEAPEPCCTSLSDTATYLLAETFDALMKCCTGDDCDGSILAYVTMGTGDDGIADTLTVGVGGVQASAGTRPGMMGLYRATFEIRLRESGWPTAYVDGGAIQLPEPALQVQAARYMLSRGEAIHRRLAFLAATRGMTPPGVRCSNGSVGLLLPIQPQGGVAGWFTTVVVDLPWG